MVKQLWEQAHKQTPQTYAEHSCSLGLLAPEPLPVLFAATELDKRRQMQWRRSRCCSEDRSQRGCCMWRLHRMQRMSPAASARRRAVLVEQWAWHGAHWTLASTLESSQTDLPSHTRRRTADRHSLHHSGLASHSPGCSRAPPAGKTMMRKAGCAWPYLLRQTTSTGALRSGHARPFSRVTLATRPMCSRHPLSQRPCTLRIALRTSMLSLMSTPTSPRH